MATNWEDISNIIAQSRHSAEDIMKNGKDEIFKFIDDAIKIVNAYDINWEVIKPMVSEIPTPELVRPITAFIGFNSDASTKLIRDDWQSQYDKLLNETFKSLNSFDLAEEKLQDLIDGNGFFIKDEIRQQIIDKVKDDEFIKSNQLKDEVTNRFTSRGFTLPSGYLAVEYDKINQSMSNVISNAVRELAIKEQDLAIDMMKFGISEALRLKPQIVGLAVDFATKYSTMYQMGYEDIRNKIEQVRIMYQSSIDYDRNQIDLYKNKVSIEEFNLKFNSDRALQQLNMQFEKMRTQSQTTIQAANSLSSIVAAALNAQINVSQLYAGGTQTTTG